jgi:hypothetical protein
MNVYDVVVATVLFVGACILQADYQAKQFKKGAAISHFWHGVYYAFFCLLIGAMYAFGVSIIDGVKISLYGSIVRLAFFDAILNLIRGKSIWYNGQQDDKLTNAESIIDWLENTVLGYKNRKRRIFILKIFYVVIWLAYIILILL